MRKSLTHLYHLYLSLLQRTKMDGVRSCVALLPIQKVTALLSQLFHVFSHKMGWNLIKFRFFLRCLLIISSHQNNLNFFFSFLLYGLHLGGQSRLVQFERGSWWKIVYRFDVPIIYTYIFCQFRLQHSVTCFSCNEFVIIPLCSNGKL